MNVLSLQTNQNKEHSHTTNTLVNSNGAAITNTGKESAHEKFSGSASHSHNLIHSRHTNYYLSYHYNSSVGYGGMRYNAGSIPMSNEDGYIITDSQTVSISGTCTGDHTHDFNHKHGTTTEGGNEARPDNYTYKVWKRVN